MSRRKCGRDRGEGKDAENQWLRPRGDGSKEKAERPRRMPIGESPGPRPSHPRRSSNAALARHTPGCIAAIRKPSDWRSTSASPSMSQSRYIAVCAPSVGSRTMAMPAPDGEKMVVAYLRSIGSTFANARPGIAKDEWPEEARVPPPDVRGIEGWAIECKNRGDHQYAKLGEAIDQLIDEMVITGDAHGAVISNRRSRPIEDAYVVMRLGDWANVVAGERARRRPPSA